MTRAMRIAVFTALTSLLMLSLPGGARGSGAGTYTPPADIDATGAKDVTAQLTSFIAGVPDGSTISFPANARYRIETSIKVANRNSLTFLGNGATFFATTPGDRMRPQFWFTLGSSLVVRNLTVVGANPNAGTGDLAYDSTREGQHAFRLEGVDGLELDHVKATDVYGDFVYIGMDLVSKRWSSNVWVHDSTFDRNGRQGISVTAGEHVLLERNSISNTRRATFDLEPNTATWGARDVTIRNNTIGAGRLNFVASHGANGPVSDITISGNKLVGKVMNIAVKADNGGRRALFTVTNNTSDKTMGTPTGALMQFSGIDSLTVTGNSEPLQAGRNMAGMAIDASCAITVSGNNFPNAVSEARISPYDCSGTA